MLVPWISNITIIRDGLACTRKDLVMVRQPIVIATLGWLLIVVAPNLASLVLALFQHDSRRRPPHPIRYFATSLVTKSDVTSSILV